VAHINNSQNIQKTEEKLEFEPEEKKFSLFLKVEFSCHKN
jgi:hypothetical protein